MTAPDRIADALLLEAHSIGLHVGRSAAVSDPRTRRANGLPRSKRQRRQVPIVIIDKSPLARAGLTHVLDGGRFRVVAACPTLGDLPEKGLNYRMCVTLICPENDDVGAITRQVAQLKGQTDGLRVIILSEQLRPDELLKAMEAGMDGYLLKSEVTPQALVQSVELVLLGGIVIPHGFRRPVNSEEQPLGDGPAGLVQDKECTLPQPQNGAPQSVDLSRLSKREQAVLKQLTLGATNKHIARELNITEATVKVHLKGLFRKLHVSNRTRAAMWAINKLSVLLFVIGSFDISPCFFALV
jgi:two-component system, NarL family, nitrate/nitrite response regulator NarL